MACLLLAATSCGPAAYDKRSEEAPSAITETVAPDSITGTGFLSSSAARVSKHDSTHKFIRTAEMKFRAQNVYTSTFVIEDIIEKHRGFVTLSDLRSTVSYTDRKRVSEDSILESTYFVVENKMSMRVPNVSLDSALREIATQIQFLDYRIIRAEDVSLRLMANKWRQKRAEKHHERLEKAIDTRAKKLREITEAEQALAEKEELADYQRQENSSLLDQVNYSTISLLVYQRQAVKNELLPDDKDVRAYEPGLLRKIGASVRAGWQVLEGFVLFLVKLWPLLLFAVLAWILLRRYVRRK